MRAGALIGISSSEIIAEQASARIGNTHCSVHKRFYFDVARDIIADFFNLVEREFASDYKPFETVVHILFCGVLVG